MIERAFLIHKWNNCDIDHTRMRVEQVMLRVKWKKGEKTDRENKQERDRKRKREKREMENERKNEKTRERERETENYKCPSIKMYLTKEIKTTK